MIQNARVAKSETIATIIGLGTLILTASGAFGKSGGAKRNWKAEPKAAFLGCLERGIAGLGLS